MMGIFVYMVCTERLPEKLIRNEMESRRLQGG